SLDWTRWTIQHDVHVCRLVYLPLHDPSRDGRYGACPVSAPTSPGHRLTLTPLFAGSMLLGSVMLVAAPVAVRHTEGIVHGFLVLRTLDGMPIADGDLKIGRAHV